MSGMQWIVPSVNTARSGVWGSTIRIRRMVALEHASKFDGSRGTGLARTRAESMWVYGEMVVQDVYFRSGGNKQICTFLLRINRNG